MSKTVNPNVLNQDHLARLEAAWRRAGAPIVDHLADGVSAEHVRGVFADVPELHIPDELLTWWGWHNGPPERYAVGGTRTCAPCEDARRYHKPFFEHPEHWLQPFGDRPWIWVECSLDRSQAGRVFTSEVGEEPRLQFDTLGQVVDTWIGFIDRGVWKYEPGSVDGTVDKSEISGRLPPEYDLA